MTNEKSGMIGEHFRQNRAAYAIVLLTFLLGSMLGSDSAVHLGDTESGLLNEFLISRSDFSSLALSDMLRTNLSAAALWCIILWVTSLAPAFSPLLAAAVGVRGYTLGFSAAFLLSDRERLTSVLPQMLPQCFLSVPLFLIFAAISLHGVFPGQREKTTAARSSFTALAFLCAALAASALECVISWGIARFFG